MKILVCVKQVPDTNTKVQVKADKSGIETNGIKWVLNPYDEFAVEEAIKLRDANAGSQLFVVTLGPKARVVDTLRTALAMGADEAMVVDAPESIDNHATAKALAAVITKEGPFDMVFTGKLAIDDQQGAVTQMIADFAKMPHASVISKFTKNDTVSTVEREVEGGSKEMIEIKGPFVLGANKGLNTPRYASLPGIMKAKKKTVKEFTLSDLGVSDSDIKVKISNFSMPAERAPVNMISGEAAAQVATLSKLLREEAKVL
ncbi:MAG: electron transfer flavoprotein subunit beta/FixA family protein [Bdellovibrionales bacterium]|nr:electron transfer flavoprotein subunit beta/FixA family protein [Bdellovibrionales bacterium]